MFGKRSSSERPVPRDPPVRGRRRRALILLLVGVTVALAVSLRSYPRGDESTLEPPF